MSEKVVYLKDWRVEKALRQELRQLDSQYIEAQRSLKKWIASQIADDNVAILRTIVKEGSIHIEFQRDDNSK